MTTKTHHLPFASVLLVLLSLSSCKTAEEIRREKLVDTLSVQVTHLQKQSSDQNFKIQEQENRLNQIYGQLEETQHEEKQRILLKEKERIKSLEELGAKIGVMEKKLAAVEKLSQKQADFISKATKHLELRLKKSNKKKRKAKNDTYMKALDLFNKKKDAKAKDLFLRVLGQKNLRPSRWAYSHHALGIIHYRQKKYEQAMVHLSKVYTKFPKSSKAPSALLHIAKSFEKLGQKDEAQGSLKQLISQYPKSKEAARGKGLLETLSN
ncbi:MAG: tetratricopeptide repeat protein [Bacteriovoracales bacterium]|nr:tetratricopeptide repeat protein [Bacteriovoracales bacterium]